MVKIKICGLKHKEDVDFARRLGVDALGFIFYGGSERVIEPDLAREIIRNIEPFISIVGVFVDEAISEVKKIISYCGIDIVQLHGNESVEYCAEFPRVIKAFRVEDEKDIEKIKEYKGITWLIDKEKNGKIHWDVAKALSKKGRIVLSGGLNPENVKEAIMVISPYAVDVSSGIEEYPGKKDHIKMEAFVKNCKIIQPLIDTDEQRIIY